MWLVRPRVWREYLSRCQGIEITAQGMSFSVGASITRPKAAGIGPVERILDRRLLGYNKGKAVEAASGLKRERHPRVARQPSFLTARLNICTIQKYLRDPSLALVLVLVAGAL